MTPYVNGQKIAIDPSKSVGKGGEADIFNIGNGLVLKLFKQPDHPDFMGAPEEAAAARERLAIHQEKLRDFPRGLPANIITPIDLAYNTAQGGTPGTRVSRSMIVGYTMKFLAGMEPLLRYSDRKFRSSIVLPPGSDDYIRSIFLDLHSSLRSIHKQNIVCGDFHDLNILIGPMHDKAFLIDTDSWQFGRYLCRTFTEKFVDPLLCDPNLTSPSLIKPHTVDSDWYAYAVMLFQCLLYVGPYGGLYKPTNIKNNIPHGARPLKRITVFHKEVRYPKPALPFSLLSDDILHYFQQVFEKDKRGIFPEKLVSNIRWTSCSTCKTWHARPTCPTCKVPAPSAVKQTIIVRGKVTVTPKIKFKSNERLLFATAQEGQLKYVYYNGLSINRETGHSFLVGSLDPTMVFRIHKDRTIVGKNGSIITVGPQEDVKHSLHYLVDSCGSVPTFDANASHIYLVTPAGQLRRGQFTNGAFDSYSHIGETLPGQTRFWVGAKFGFGFYRAAQLHVAFVFDANSSGINDTVKIPRISGQLLDATCVFADGMAWSFTSSKHGPKTINQCVVVQPDGTVIGTAQAEDGDGSWLGTIRGKCAVGNILLVATDEGIVRIECKNGSLQKNADFPDTEPFVDSSTRLIVTKDGLMAVSPREISHIKMD